MDVARRFPAVLSLRSFCIAGGTTAFCCLRAPWAVGSNPWGLKKKSRPIKSGKMRNNSCDCSCSPESDSSCWGCSDCGPKTPNQANGEVMLRENGDVATFVERQTGGSMMEQLVPEITTHALSYLDYPSLCRLSMTNSSMRRAANDDSAWKSLYHKDFTMEQDSVTPVNGWKAYYAATKAVMNINADFYNIIRDRSLPAMSRIWLHADYVKCIHGSGEFFTGYTAVMESWELALNWVQGGQGVVFEIRDVRVRAFSDIAWVTMKAYVNVDSGPFHITNVYEFHNGQWYMVLHHSSVMLGDGEVGHPNFLG